MANANLDTTGTLPGARPRRPGPGASERGVTKLMQRPQVGSLTVPFMVDERRAPIDFKAVDEAHVALCAKHRRCGVCGGKLRRGPFAFIGPTDGRRCFTDPWMHPDCARLAMQQCPFLAGRRDWRDSSDRQNGLLRPYSAGMSVLLAPDGRAHRDQFGAWHFEAVGLPEPVA